MTVAHTAYIYWINDQGYTTCSEEYRQTLDEIDTVYDPLNEDGITLDDLSPEDYQRYSELTDKLGLLQMNGHVGDSVRYY